MRNIKFKIDSIVKKFNEGKQIKALEEINVLLKTDNKNTDLLLLKANMFINLNKYIKSIEILKSILIFEPKNKDILKKIYTILLTTRNYRDADFYLNRLLIFEKNYETLRDKAFLLYTNKDYDNAQKFINEAFVIKNNEAFGLNISGLLKIELREFKGALKNFIKAISINPNYADSYNNAGRCCIYLENLNLAFYYFKKAYRINPRSDLAIQNIGNVLSLNDKNIFAIKFYEKARKINPKNASINENIALSHIKLKNLKWIENYYFKEKNNKDINQDIVLGYSYLLLANNRFKEGFDIFDSRLKTKKFPEKNIYHKNLYEKIIGEKKIEEKQRILVVKEQGIGDEILFSSMYKDLIKKFSNIKIECDERLINIFERSFKRKIFHPYGFFSSSLVKINKFDNIIYAGSLTRYFRKNESDFISEPYLETSNSRNIKMKKKIDLFNNTKKIGISWKSVVNIYGNLKSLKINNFKKIFNTQRTFINLQYGNVESELNNFLDTGYKIYTFKEIDLFNDFDSLMSLLKNIDIFVTVSNSTAHFAGALGIPTILICPKKVSTYYYWDYNNGKTPWYKSVNIIKFDKSISHTMEKVNKLIDKI